VARFVHVASTLFSRPSRNGGVKSRASSAPGSTRDAPQGPILTSLDGLCSPIDARRDAWIARTRSANSLARRWCRIDMTRKLSVLLWASNRTEDADHATPRSSRKDRPSRTAASMGLARRSGARTILRSVRTDAVRAPPRRPVRVDGHDSWNRRCVHGQGTQERAFGRANAPRAARVVGASSRKGAATAGARRRTHRPKSIAVEMLPRRALTAKHEPCSFTLASDRRRERRRRPVRASVRRGSRTEPRLPRRGRRSRQARCRRRR